MLCDIPYLASRNIGTSFFFFFFFLLNDSLSHKHPLTSIYEQKWPISTKMALNYPYLLLIMQLLPEECHLKDLHIAMPSGHLLAD